MTRWVVDIYKDYFSVLGCKREEGEKEKEIRVLRKIPSDMPNGKDVQSYVRGFMDCLYAQYGFSSAVVTTKNDSEIERIIL